MITGQGVYSIVLIRVENVIDINRLPKNRKEIKANASAVIVSIEKRTDILITNNLTN